MKDIIIGASGFVGNALYSALIDSGHDIIGTYHNRKKNNLIRLNMMSKDELEKLFNKFEPKIVYIPAFIPHVDKCEVDTNIQNINKNGIRNVIDTCKEHSSKPVFFSSDYVFDGLNGPYSEMDDVNPINQYGKIKLLCEKLIMDLEDYLIVRTTGIYGYDMNSKNFLMTLVQDLKRNMIRKVPIDQMGSPTHVIDLVDITIKLVNKNKRGIYNIAGPDFCSRYVFALKIARNLGIDENLILPVKSSELNQAAERPLKAGLIIDKIRSEIDAKPSCIDQVINQLKNNF